MCHSANRQRAHTRVAPLHKQHIIERMAMEAVVTTVKSINAEEGRVGGYLVVWGDTSTRDLQGEYFSPQTDLALDSYEARPVLYHHGLDGNLKAAVIGR